MGDLGGDGRGQAFQESKLFTESSFEFGEIADDVTADQETIRVAGDQGNPGRIDFFLVIEEIGGGQGSGEHDGKIGIFIQQPADYFI